MEMKENAYVVDTPCLVFKAAICDVKIADPN